MAANDDVEQVYVAFKTHLDIGYTDLSSKVIQTYVENFIPHAIQVADELRNEGGEERYVWTVGSWLILEYLQRADPAAVAKLEEAIRRGDICWNGVPYTVESESANKALYEGFLGISKNLDRRFGKKTVAAKMTDVPGHTRSIVPLLAKNGIKVLHIGVNGGSAVPDVPTFSRWKDEASGEEIILFYQGSYGEMTVLPDGRTAVGFVFTSDNQGPHTASQVKGAFARLRKEFPKARITACSMNEIAEALYAVRDSLPVITAEIGDTWIYGYGSSPLRMERFRELSRLYAQWISEGSLEAGSELAVRFAAHLGLIAEHTWGVTMGQITNYDKYDFDTFSSSRQLPEFLRAEASWKELDQYVDEAIGMLPKHLQEQAYNALEKFENVQCTSIVPNKSTKAKVDSLGRYLLRHKGKTIPVGGLTYRAYSYEDYQSFRTNYLRVWAEFTMRAFGKPGFEDHVRKGTLLEARNIATGRNGKSTVCEMQFPKDEQVDERVHPERMQIRYTPSGKGLDIDVVLLHKPAVRMPESYWFSFQIPDIRDIIAEKTGQEVDLLDVVSGGNRQMHGIDNYVDIVTDKGTLRITSYDAPLLSIGDRNSIGFSRDMPDVNKGIHFCLYNNTWGTNFQMWWEGSICYRFHLEFVRR